MAIPTAPTIAAIVTEALKRAGRTAPSATQISEATTHQLREVKADIMLAAPTHPYLLGAASGYTIKGQQRYSQPPDANVPVSLTLLMGPTTWAGTAQAGSASTLTLASTFSEDATIMYGKGLLLTGGTGQGQYRNCVGYNDTTKVWTPDSDWEVTPDVTSTYQMMNSQRSLWPLVDPTTELNTLANPFTLGVPQMAGMSGDEYIFYPIPDYSTYGLYYRYYVDLDQLDDNGTIFLNLLREWRSLWIQGIAVKCMQRYDEERYMSELQVYKIMLDALATQTTRVTRIGWRDV